MLGRGNKDCVNEILKIIIEGFINFPPLKFREICGEVRVVILFVFSLAFFCKIVIQNLLKCEIDFIGVVKIV